MTLSAPARLARHATLCLALFASAASLPACGGAQVEDAAWAPGPAIPGLNLNGRWYSRDFGDMELLQEGTKISGKYEHPRGPEHNGTVRGDILGDLLKIEWIQPGDASAAVFPIKGRAVFRVARDGMSLDGVWGYDDDYRQGGVWQAQKSKQDQ